MGKTLRHVITWHIIGLAWFALLPAALADSHSAKVLDDYGLNPGDLLGITVWKEPDLARQTLVLPDGSFTFPLVGDVEAAGRSVAEVRTELTERLNNYIPEPVVTVTVEQALGNKVFVLGQVGRSGEIIVGSQLDITQALAIAGGFTPFAQVNDISVLRRVDGNLLSIPFRYSDIEKGKRLNQNILLQPGDVVIVP